MFQYRFTAIELDLNMLPVVSDQTLYLIYDCQRVFVKFRRTVPIRRYTDLIRGVYLPDWLQSNNHRKSRRTTNFNGNVNPLSDWIYEGRP